MKTGKAAALLNVDRKTILEWVKRFPEFFTDSAKAVGNMQADLEDTDIILINTIRNLRREGEQDWEKMRDILYAGRRDAQLPPSAVYVDTGETTLVQVQQVLDLRARYEVQKQELDELRVKVKSQSDDISELTRRIRELELQQAADARELDLWRKGKLHSDEET